MGRDNTWLQCQIENMREDHRMLDSCRCMTKTPVYTYHEKYCPVWKNGKIAELEADLKKTRNESIEVIHNIEAERIVLEEKVKQLESAIQSYLDDYETPNWKYAKHYRNTFKQLLGDKS